MNDGETAGQENMPVLPGLSSPYEADEEPSLVEEKRERERLSRYIAFGESV